VLYQKRGRPPEQAKCAADVGLLRDKQDENTYPIQITALQWSNIGKIKGHKRSELGQRKSGNASPDERSAIGISATITISLALWKGSVLRLRANSTEGHKSIEYVRAVDALMWHWRGFSA
jgi:hypothetical protein